MKSHAPAATVGAPVESLGDLLWSRRCCGFSRHTSDRGASAPSKAEGYVAKGPIQPTQRGAMKAEQALKSPTGKDGQNENRVLPRFESRQRSEGG
jgi:hypothetical protein